MVAGDWQFLHFTHGAMLYLSSTPPQELAVLVTGARGDVSVTYDIIPGAATPQELQNGMFFDALIF